MLDHGVKRVTDEIKLKAAKAIADSVSSPTADQIVPSIFDPGLHERVAESVR
jgi:malate dehydrogenase (oxaloacetate-decarboxylating)